MRNFELSLSLSRSCDAFESGLVDAYNVKESSKVVRVLQATARIIRRKIYFGLPYDTSIILDSITSQ